MNKPFFGGVPTDTEVNALVEAYKNVAIGIVIPHADLEALAKCGKRTSRYRTIISTWRRRMLLEFNIDMDSVYNTGYRVLDAAGRVSASMEDFGTGVRRVRKASDRIRRAPIHELPAAEQRDADHKVVLMSHAENELVRTHRKLRIPLDLPSPAEPTRPVSGGRS